MNGNKAVTVHEVAMKLCISPKIVVYDEVEGFESLESILDDKHFDKNEVNEFSCTTSNMRNTAVMLFSSGTTGLPKAVEISQTMFIVPAFWQVPRQSSGSIGLWFGSLSWITSVVLTVRTILSFSTAVKYAGFDSEKVCRVIEKYKVLWNHRNAEKIQERQNLRQRFITSATRDRKSHFAISFRIDKRN